MLTELKRDSGKPTRNSTNTISLPSIKIRGGYLMKHVLTYGHEIPNTRTINDKLTMKIIVHTNKILCNSELNNLLQRKHFLKNYIRPANQ
jgi:hypothetical protein